MEFASQKELYNFLLPVFNVKRRINKYYGYTCNDIDIWLYLSKNKWHKCNNLCLCDIVFDIINFDIYKLKGMKIYE